MLSPNKLLVSWKEPKGDFDSYLFLYSSIPGMTAPSAGTGEERRFQKGHPRIHLLLIRTFCLKGFKLTQLVLHLCHLSTFQI